MVTYIMMSYSVGIYLFRVNNRKIRRMCDICSKLTMKTPSVFIVNFEQIININLVFLLLTLNRYIATG